jgi:hypothetical protein
LLRRITQQVHEQSVKDVDAPNRWVVPVEKLKPMLSWDEWTMLVNTGLFTEQTLEELCSGHDVQFDEPAE